MLIALMLSLLPLPQSDRGIFPQQNPYDAFYYYRVWVQPWGENGLFSRRVWFRQGFRDRADCEDFLMGRVIPEINQGNGYIMARGVQFHVRYAYCRQDDNLT